MSSGESVVPGGVQTCPGGEDASNQLLCLLSNPFAQTFKATTIWTAIAYSLGSMVLIILGFCLIRPRNSIVYAPKLKYADEKHAPPVIGKGLMDWTPPLAKLHEAELVDKIGLDATVFLRFTKMLRNIFVVMTVIAMGLLLPTNIISGLRSAEAKAFNTRGFWTISTPQYTKGGVLWVHVIAVWVINLIVAFFLWRNYIAVTRLRRGYYESPAYLKSLHSRTLMFTDIPAALRTDEGILRLSDQVEQTTSIPRASIGRNVKELPELIEEHEKAVKELESVLAKYLKNPDKLPAHRPTLRSGVSKVDAIEYLTTRISELEVHIQHVRESIDKRNPMTYGFASFEKIEEAHTVAYAARKNHPQGAMISLAPGPKDIIWKNMPLTQKERSWKRFINNFWILVLTFVWIAPNTLIAIFLSNLSNLANVWKGFRTTYNADPKLWAVVQGIASPALTSLVFLLLPIAFRRLSIHAGDRTKTIREQNVTTKLYAFFVFNNLVIFSVFSALWAFVTTVIAKSKIKDETAWEAIRDGYFFRNMQLGLIEVTPFWLTWLLQRNLGSAADLAQMLQLFWIWFIKTFTSPTPRQRVELTAPLAFEYAVYYNYFLFYATVAFCFTTLQPLVVPVTAFYFVIDYWLKKYLLLYVLITKTESGGQFWRILFNRMIFAIILADCVIAVVIKASGYWTMIAVMAPLPILLIVFKFYCAKTFDARNDFYTRALTSDPELMADSGKKSRRNDRVSSKFAHPALHSKLMTPMVHAKAQHVLGTIYRGRLDDINKPLDAADAGIAMNDMSQSQPGKVLAFADSKHKRKELFEIVPENKLDFSYFKYRQDFADENGGDGELYGRPADLVSERSGTPHSFFRGSGGSPSSSRASSPGPYMHSRGGSGSPSGSGQYESYRQTGSPQQRLQQMHPAYRDGSGSGSNPGDASWRRHNYRGSDAESETNLLRGAQPVGMSNADEETGQPIAPSREMYGLDRWRTGGAGYQGVPGGEGDLSAPEFEPTGYDTYRGRRH